MLPTVSFAELDSVSKGEWWENTETGNFYEETSRGIRENESGRYFLRNKNYLQRRILISLQIKSVNRLQLDLHKRTKFKLTIEHDSKWDQLNRFTTINQTFYQIRDRSKSKSEIKVIWTDKNEKQNDKN